jgi:hypothetical protein
MEFTIQVGWRFFGQDCYDTNGQKLQFVDREAMLEYFSYRTKNLARDSSFIEIYGCALNLSHLFSLPFQPCHCQFATFRSFPPILTSATANYFTVSNSYFWVFRQSLPVVADG